MRPPTNFHKSPPFAPGKHTRQNKRHQLLMWSESVRIGKEVYKLIREGHKHEIVVYTISKHDLIQGKGSLVDGGSNGGCAGLDMKVICFHNHRRIDITGIQNHQVTDIRCATVGGVTNSNIGPILIVCHQYAWMGQGETIHSKGQLSYFGATQIDCSGYPQGFLAWIGTRIVGFKWNGSTIIQELWITCIQHLYQLFGYWYYRNWRSATSEVRQSQPEARYGSKASQTKKIAAGKARKNLHKRLFCNVFSIIRDRINYLKEQITNFYYPVQCTNSPLLNTLFFTTPFQCSDNLLLNTFHTLVGIHTFDNTRRLIVLENGDRFFVISFQTLD